MKTKFFKAYILAIMVAQLSFAQEKVYMTGLLPDDGTYDTLPTKTELLTRDYVTIPSKYSLVKYCPSVESQDDYHTCVGWATAYAARTIAEAVKYGWTDKNKITSEAFSPLFVYALIAKDDYGRPPTNCNCGSHIYSALQLMKEKGVPKFSSFDVLCANSVGSELYPQALHYKIDDYFTLFNNPRANAVVKIQSVKKSLSEDCPVIISMRVEKSFMSAGQIWDGKAGGFQGYHAMCVVGYDDEKYGGAFCVMNSWGNDWGDNGFVWIHYSDFAKYVDRAYEIYVRKLPKPTPAPIVEVKPHNFAGKLELRLKTGDELMQATLQTTEVMNTYRLTESYISGTRYRLYITNNEPAYVYVIGSDLTGDVSKVFPPKNTISAALTYKSNHIAIPDERYYIEMNKTTGTDYMCVLYSMESIDIDAVIAKMKSINGSFYNKLKGALQDKLVPNDDIQYQKNSIDFSAQSKQMIVPIIVEIPHR